MTTARTIIKKALQKNGVLTKNESPSGDEASDALDSLNAMISSWSNDSLLIYTRQIESFPIVGGQNEYTIGTGGDFNTTRPMQIVSAFLRIGNIDYDIQVVNGVQYDNIDQKDISSSIPEVLFYDANVPLAKITMYPVPTTGTLHLRTEKELTQLTTLDSDIEFPPGWERALVYNLAVEIGSEYGQPIDQVTFNIAQESLNKIKTATARNRNMDIYPDTRQRYNIYTGW